MAVIVFVHGIANEQSGSYALESAWKKQLASGVRLAGDPKLADRIAQENTIPGAIDARMAFYGDLYLKPGSQGISSAALTEAEEQLAEEWLKNVAARSSDPLEREQARRALNTAAGGAGAQGAGAALGWTIRTLSKLSWFADPIYGAAAFVKKSLHQVTRYLEEKDIRLTAQDRVLDLIGPETKVIIAHSLGSVVAWETLRRRPFELSLFLTLGSPLGLPNIVYPKLVPPQVFPEPVKKWINVADRDDFIAAEPNLGPLFPGGNGRFTGTWTVDNGASPHNAEFYLGKEMIGRAVAEALI